MQNRIIRCDDPSTDALNKIVGKSIGHCWIVVEWEETRYTPGGYSYTVQVNGGSGGNGYYPNAGGGGVNGNNNPETVTKKAKKKMCQYCGMMENI